MGARAYSLSTVRMQLKWHGATSLQLAFKIVCLFYVAILANFGLINFSYCLERQQVFLGLFMLLCACWIIASTPPTVAKNKGQIGKLKLVFTTTPDLNYTDSNTG